MYESKSFIVESHSIDYISPELRHGKISDLFFIWFSANMELPVLLAGAVTVVKGFSLAWAIVAIIVGALIGGLLMAYHSAQGPHLGLPQMIQSRAQFGFYGANIPLVLVILMYLGFYAAGAVLGGQALAALIPIPLSASIVIMSIFSMVVTILGYNLIHKFEKYLSYFVAFIFVLFTLTLIFEHKTNTSNAVTSGHFILGPFLLAVALSATSQLGYAPYVADYSRYLPERTTISGAFWYTYAGISLSGVWLMILGAIIQDKFPKLGTVEGLGTIASSFGSWFEVLTYIALTLGIISINSLNLYGGYMSSLSFFSSFFKNWRSGITLRLLFIIPVTIVATWMSFLYKSNLLGSYETFLTIVLATLIPWTAINLTDYYFVRNGKYEVEEMFKPRGIYGWFNGPGLISYVTGFLIQFPFMNNSIYDGTIAKMLDNGDISWIIGAIVAGVLYLVLMRRRVMNLESDLDINATSKIEN